MMQRSPILDEGREFRYSLERTWNSDIDFGHRDPVGPENDGHLERLAGECKAVAA